MTLRAVLLTVLWMSTGCGACTDLGDPVHADCGNGVIDGLEICDGTALGGESCASRGFARGELSCAPTCGGFVIAGCEGFRDDVEPCGNCEPVCVGEPITRAATLEFDITVVRVTGTVTVADAIALPAGSTLLFRGDVTNDPAIVSLAADGTYEARLEPGLYQVTWEPPPGALLATERLPDLDVGDADEQHDFVLTAWTLFEPEIETNYPGILGDVVLEHLDPRFGRITAALAPDSEFLLRDGEYRVWWTRRDAMDLAIAEFVEATTRDALIARGTIEIPVVKSALHVTMNGAAIVPTGTVRAELVRRDELPRPGWLSVSKDREAWTLDPTGRASGWMLDRPRDVAAVINGPPWWGWIWAQRDVTPAAEITIDLVAPRVAGEVRRNGTRLPNSALDGITRGRLEFSSEHGYVAVELSDRGPGTFAVRLPRGLWDVTVTGIVFAGVLPVVPWDVPDVLDVRDDILDRIIDVPAVRLAGQLTVNGAPPEDDTDVEMRGSLQLSTVDGNAWYSVPIPARGPAAWDTIVAPGQYRAELVRWWFVSTGEAPPLAVLPLGVWELDDFDVPVATRYDVDVRLHDVTVVVEEHGAPAPPGLLWFTRHPEHRVARQIATADGAATVALYPGYYSVEWAPYNDDGLAVGPIVLDSALAVDGEITHTYDVGRVELRGTILVNGAAATDAGDLDVELIRYPFGNWRDIAPLNPTGAASFAADIVPGHYTIMLAGSDHTTLPHHGVVLLDSCGP